MRIIILTIDSYNHGNRLQNFALTRVLGTCSDATVKTARIRNLAH